MLKYLLLLVVFFSCTPPKAQETPVSNHQIMRLKSIVYSPYNSSQEKFLPLYERKLTYSNNNNQLEYVVLKNGKEVTEKHIAQYQDNKLVSLSQNSFGNESEQLYEYNPSGDLTSYIHTTDRVSIQERFIYDDQKLVKQETYDYSDPENKTLISEENYVYDSLNRTMNKVYTSQSETKTTHYVFNSKNQIISKTEPYKKYKIDHIGDTLIHIRLQEGADFDSTVIITTIHFNPNGLLSKFVTTSEWEKNTTSISYDENDFPSELLYITEYDHGLIEYNKYEIGPYTMKSKVIFPSWNVDYGIFGVAQFVNILDSILGENQLNTTIINRQNHFFKSIPDYYIEYHSTDGKNWKPERKTEYNFQTTGNQN